MPDDPPRLFLSYGVRDASTLAGKLHRGLSAHGYRIWQDIKDIQAPRPWDIQIEKGLQESQVVVALLSPHSVRRVGSPANPTASDSVCLDEIAYSRFHCKIPIVPVKVEACATPFVIYRLQEIDFRNWNESESVFQSGLAKICDAVQAAMRGESRERIWGPWAEPLDFAPFLEDKRKFFTGRRWLFQEIEEWLKAKSEPALLITGEPGIGKSAIVAALVHANPDGQILAYHCCRADTPATLEPGRFVRSVAAMLFARFEDYAAILEGSSAARTDLERADDDPASAFEHAILNVLHKVRLPKTGRQIILIDALDEALTRPKEPTIVDVLCTRLQLLPSWLGIVATTRNEPEVLRQLRALRAYPLAASDLKNQEDARQYVEMRLAGPTLREKAQRSEKALSELVTNLLKTSAANFLFLRASLDAVETGQLRLGQFESLPPGLGSLYEIFFNRFFRDARVGFEPSRHVLETVAAAREPLTRKQIAAITGLDAEAELPSVLGRLASFIPVREGCYTLFHRSLFEWLTGWDMREDQPFAGPYHVNLRLGNTRLADWCWAEYRRSPAKASIYCLRHLPAHLLGADRDEDAKTALLDFEFLEAKLKATDASSLITDYDYLHHDEDARVVQSAIRVADRCRVYNQELKANFRSQLYGRLLTHPSPSIQAMLERIRQFNAGPWLRPLTPILATPGEAPQRAILGHKEAVKTVTVTADGTCAVSIAIDKTVIVWSLTGQLVRPIQFEDDPIDVVRIRGEEYVACSTSGDSVKILHLENGSELCVLSGNVASVRGVAVTPDGRCVVGFLSSNTLNVWNGENMQLLFSLAGHSDRITAVAVSANGEFAVSASWDKTLIVWDLKSGTKLRTLEGHQSGVHTLALFPGEKRVVSGSGMRGGWPGAGAFFAEYLPEGFANELKVWELESGRCLFTLEGHKGHIYKIALTKDGRRAISSSWDSTLKVWDLESKRTMVTFWVDANPLETCAVSPDGLTIVAGDSLGRVHFLRLEGLTEPEINSSIEEASA